ncbi:MAG: hypothetical protein KAU21_05680 [Gammaproteobacteria bacterium]|nr:hypothetical protein [Gammaproteobacteria bacterium]
MKPGSKKLIIINLLVASFFLAISTITHADNFLIISDLNHRYHQEIAEDIESELDAEGHVVESISDSDRLSINFSEFSSIITIGYKAASQTIISTTRKPVLSLLIPKQVFTHFLKNNINKKYRHLFSSIYIDQPLKRRIQLIKQLSSSFKTIGILYGKNSYSRKNNITLAIRKSGLIVNNITVLDLTELIPETRHLSEEADILLAIADSTIYNRR